MKKVISILLAISIFFSFSCFALTPDEAAKDLGKYSIMGGFPDGTLRLENNITRAQITKMIVTAMGEKGFFGMSSGFSDVPGTYWGTSYISFARLNNIIGGFPDGSFKPEDNVTCEQALKMIACMLKYDKYLLSRYPGRTELMYPTDYIAIAHDAKLTQGLQFRIGEPATRGFVAVVLSRALDLPLTYEGDGGVWVFSDGKDGRENKTLRTVLES